jgi:choline kinase
MKRAILIAAGRGKRLGSHTEEVPKCLVEVGARTILGWVWHAFTAAGIEELVVIRGYRGDTLEASVRALAPPPVKIDFVDNTAWQTNNVLQSMACARRYLDRPCLISYSDIIFTPAVARAAVASTAEIGLVIDRDFRSIYVGRTEHPLEEGEVSDLMPDGSVARVGKRALSPDGAVGEYIGLCRLGARGVAIVANTLDALAKKFDGREEEPFQRAASFRNAYQTDLWQHLIDAGIDVDPVFIDGSWREIDTGQDLDRARLLVESAPKDWS